MRPQKRPFCRRVTGTDFILKLVSLLAAWGILHLWTTEKGFYERLPCKSYFEWDLYFHTVNGYIFVLSGQLLLYFLGEIPGLVVQRVVCLYGAGLFLACGLVGMINYLWLQEKLQLKMLFIALLCFVPFVCLMWDHLWQEEYFKPQPENRTLSKVSSKVSTDTESRTNITPSASTIS